VFVVAAFDTTNPLADLRSFDEDLILPTWRSSPTASSG